LWAAEVLSLAPGAELFSSMNTSAIKLLMTEGLTGAYVRDHRTTPEVVRISKVSNMAGGWARELDAPGWGGSWYSLSSCRLDYVDFEEGRSWSDVADR